MMFLEQRKGVGGKRRESGDDIQLWNQHNHIFILLRFDFNFLFEWIEVPTQHWKLKIHWILGHCNYKFYFKYFVLVLHFDFFCFSFYFPFILLSFYLFFLKFCHFLVFSPCSIVVLGVFFVSFLLCTKLAQWGENVFSFFSL